ncbi:MAG: hypothetical protein HZA91_15850 [Verrucomicrobia bacterium]|nr:hypothetical protein [Verrucomicrobiota bacterium]
MKRKPKPAALPQRKLIGFFQTPPADACPEAQHAWVNSIVDEMQRVDKEEEDAERVAKRAKAKVGK